MDSSYTSPTTKPLYRATQTVWYVLGIVEILLTFRFLLKLLGANPEAGFTAFIYGITGLIAGPFLNVFNITEVEGSVFEWTTLLAMLVYLFLAFAVIKLLALSKTVSTPEAARKMDHQDDEP